MKAHLMYRDRDFDINSNLPQHYEDLIKDLELNTIFYAMASGDEVLNTAAVKGVLNGLSDRQEITYRQEVLKDCLANEADVRDLYQLVVEILKGEKKVRWWGFSNRYPSSILRGAVNVMEYYLETFRKLKKRAESLAPRFGSEGFSVLFSMLKNELNDDYLALVRVHLENLKFRRGTLISAVLGPGNKGTGYMLNKPEVDKRNFFERLFTKKPETYSYRLADRDDAGARYLSEIQDKGFNSVADALSRSTDHINNFYTLLRNELAFYIGCLNLHNSLSDLNTPVCFPDVYEAGMRVYSYEGLYDICLALTMTRDVVGNSGSVDNIDFTIVTGANQGGKSTFLRSI